MDNFWAQLCLAQGYNFILVPVINKMILYVTDLSATSQMQDKVNF